MAVIGIPRETAPGESRVALTPDMVGRLAKTGYELIVERGAGESAYFPDTDYEAEGARVVSRDEALGADLVATVTPPEDELDKLRSGAVVIGFMQPLDRPELAAALAERGVTALSMEMVPRITRAQKMDALSAKST